MSKCQYCGKGFTHVRLEATRVQNAKGGEWNGVIYYCPSCRAVLSVGIDPVALKNDTVQEILRELGKG
jgi:hypothetical protein